MVVMPALWLVTARADVDIGRHPDRHRIGASCWGPPYRQVDRWPACLVETVSIEHKMGIKGSATATLNFGENGNCIGEILGNEREGMKIMFTMMNEARLDTGMQGLDLASVKLRARRPVCQGEYPVQED